jgi:signal transduction histidine kinase
MVHRGLVYDIVHWSAPVDVCLRLEDEAPFRSERDAAVPRRDYPGLVERPVTTAFGWRLPTWLLDYGPVAFIVLESLVAIRFDQSTPRLVLGLGVAVSAIALVLRHRSPMLSLGVVLVVALAVGYGPIITLPVMLALFTVAEYTPRPQLLVAAVLGCAAVIGGDLIHGGHPAPGQLISHAVLVGLAVALGSFIRARADYVTGLRDRATRLERERELLADQAVAEERVRIARELHDVVAHNVSLMVVQSQALAATRGDPDNRATLGSVADLGREALSEMHRMLGLLRLQDGDSGVPEREPQPGVRDLERLIARTRETGLDTRLEVQGTPHELPPGVELSAYRIVQEALTNVIRHAGARSADVRLVYAPDAVEVSVVDDGVGAASLNGSDGGHGLVGLRERVALFGGRFSAGPADGGHGYQVRATLPVG